MGMPVPYEFFKCNPSFPPQNSKLKLKPHYAGGRMKGFYGNCYASLRGIPIRRGCTGPW